MIDRELHGVPSLYISFQPASSNGRGSYLPQHTAARPRQMRSGMTGLMCAAEENHTDAVQVGQKLLIEQVILHGSAVYRSC